MCSERGGTAALSGFCPVVGLVDRDENGLLIPGTASLKVKGNDVRMFIVTRSKASLYSINWDGGAASLEDTHDYGEGWSNGVGMS